VLAASVQRAVDVTGWPVSRETALFKSGRVASSEEMLTSTGNRKSSCCSLVAGRPYEADTKACCDKQAG